MSNPGAYHFIRREILEGINRFVLRHQRVGHFLMAVLKNDLRQALARADSDNATILLQIVSYCHNEIPGICWGSPQKVEAWLNLEPKNYPKVQAPENTREIARQDEAGIWGWKQHQAEVAANPEPICSDKKVQP